MNIRETLLNWPLILRIRRNHALEHATLQVLARKLPTRPLAGYSDGQGFWVLGSVPTETLQEALDEALMRLRSGERALAVHPTCGTNFVVAGVFAGVLAWLLMLNTPHGARNKLERLPTVISFSTLGILLSQPFGPLLQAHVTTEANLGNLEVTELVRFQRQNGPMHRVRTKSS